MEHVPIGKVVGDGDDATRTATAVLLASRAYWQTMIDGPVGDDRKTPGGSTARDGWSDRIEAIDQELARRGVPPSIVIVTTEEELRRKAAAAFMDSSRFPRSPASVPFTCPCGADLGPRPTAWRELVERGCVQVDDTQLWHCGPACPAIGGKALRKLPTIEEEERALRTTNASVVCETDSATLEERACAIARHQRGWALVWMAFGLFGGWLGAWASVVSLAWFALILGGVAGACLCTGERKWTSATRLLRTMTRLSDRRKQADA